ERRDHRATGSRWRPRQTARRALPLEEGTATEDRVRAPFSRHAGVPCGKEAYSSKADVRRRLGRWQRHWTMYWCPPCGAYHVSSARAQRRRRQQDRARRALAKEE